VERAQRRDPIGGTAALRSHFFEKRSSSEVSVEANASRFERNSSMSRSARVPPFVSVHMPRPALISVSSVARVSVLSPGWYGSVVKESMT